MIEHPGTTLVSEIVIAVVLTYGPMLMALGQIAAGAA